MGAYSLILSVLATYLVLLIISIAHTVAKTAEFYLKY